MPNTKRVINSRIKKKIDLPKLRSSPKLLTKHFHNLFLAGNSDENQTALLLFLVFASNYYGEFNYDTNLLLRYRQTLIYLANTNLNRSLPKIRQSFVGLIESGLIEKTENKTFRVNKDVLKVK